jgi:uncharacterized protein YjiS (DUF1127 family)
MSIQFYHPASVTAKLAIADRARHAAAMLAEALSEWRERSRQRHTLGRLDDRLLRDMGLTRADVDQEVSKPFWQA